MLKLSSRGAIGRVISINFWSSESVDELVLLKVLVDDLRRLLKRLLPILLE